MVKQDDEMSSLLKDIAYPIIKKVKNNKKQIF